MTFVIYRGERKYTIENAMISSGEIGITLQQNTLSTLTDNDLHSLSLSSLLTDAEDTGFIEEGKVNPRIGIFCDTENIN